MDIEAELAELARTHPGRANYTPMDRYRDFRAVFLGSDQGKRVLHEILGMGHMFQPSAAALGSGKDGPVQDFATNKTFYRDGERNLALRIFATARVEPQARPGTQNKTAEEPTNG